MGDPYCPFMGKKGRSWGELDLSSIAGRVAAAKTPPEVESAVRALAVACRKHGVELDDAKKLLDGEFQTASVATSSRSRRR